MLLSELFFVRNDILIEDLFYFFVVQDVVVGHLQRQLTELISLVDGADFLIKKQFDQPGVPETARFMQWIVIVLIAVLLHLVSHTLIRWILEIFDQDQFDYLLLVVLDSEHERRLLFLLLSQKGRYAMVVQDVVDYKNVPAHARPVQITILD